MALFKALADAIYQEYDRRIKRASEIVEYGMHHGHHGHHGHHDHGGHGDEAEDAEEDEGSVISNVPIGAQVGRSYRSH